jgi:hypothetical protein
MYPGRAHDFLQKFEEVTKEPYSYLVVDLKPETPNGGDYVPTSSRKKHRTTSRPIERSQWKTLTQTK